MHCNKDSKKSKEEQVIDFAAYTLMWELCSDDAKAVISVLDKEENRALFHQKCVEYLAEYLAKSERTASSFPESEE